VRFVEFIATIPIQGPESEILEKFFTSDFLALLGTNQREIVVLLPRAYRRYKIAEQLEYANHSPISKKLAHIRHQAAEQFFGLDTGSVTG